MFPIRDENPQLRTPWVTFVIIGINVLAWTLLQGLGSEPALSRSICQLGLIPGDYIVEVTPPAGYEATTATADPNDDDDLRAAHALQDQVSIQQAETGVFEVPSMTIPSQPADRSS